MFSVFIVPAILFTYRKDVKAPLRTGLCKIIWQASFALHICIYVMHIYAYVYELFVLGFNRFCKDQYLQGLVASSLHEQGRPYVAFDCMHIYAYSTIVLIVLSRLACKIQLLRIYI